MKSFVVDLTGPFSFVVGNFDAGSFPVKLLRRVSIYKSAHFLNSSPTSINDLITSKYGNIVRWSCFLILGPSHLLWEAPPLEHEEVFHSGRDHPRFFPECKPRSQWNRPHHCSKCPEVGFVYNISRDEGLSFDGSQQISVSVLGLTLITGTITVGFKWSTTPPSAFQTLFEEATENMRLEISPIVGTVKFHFKGVDYFTGSTFTFCK